MSITVESNFSGQSLKIRAVSSDYIEVSLERKDMKMSHIVFLHDGVSDLVSFFEDLSKNWKGWAGVKIWTSIEEDFQIEAVCDSTGNVTLKVALLHDVGGSDWWEYRTSLVFGSGNLENIYGLVLGLLK